MYSNWTHTWGACVVLQFAELSLECIRVYVLIYILDRSYELSCKRRRLNITQDIIATCLHQLISCLPADDLCYPNPDPITYVAEVSFCSFLWFSYLAFCMEEQPCPWDWVTLSNCAPVCTGLFSLCFLWCSWTALSEEGTHRMSNSFFWSSGSEGDLSGTVSETCDSSNCCR